MSRDRQSNWGVLAVIAAVTFAALAYWIPSANQAPTLPYAIAQCVLLGSVLVVMIGSVAKCRPARPARIDPPRPPAAPDRQPR
jgi:peptidoglycan/LPS O-acetylase OafA/YrhL